MENILEVNDLNFEDEVIKSEIPVLIDFGANWCGPCKRQIPIVEQFANNNVKTIKVVKVDIDDSPLVASKLGIRGVPSLVLFKEGKQVGMKVGLTDLKGLNTLVFGDNK